MNLLRAVDIIDALRRDDPTERLAATLLNLMAHTPSVLPTISVSQADLGAIARLSKSTVNRALAELARRGWVRLRYNAVEFVDVKSLSELVWGEQDVARQGIETVFCAELASSGDCAGSPLDILTALSAQETDGDDPDEAAFRQLGHPAPAISLLRSAMAS